MDGLLVHTRSIPASLDFAQSLPIRRLVDVLGDRLLVCMKVLLLARPLIVLSRSATTSSFFSVALASLFPMTISSLADGSLSFESSATFDRKVCPQWINLLVRILTHLFSCSGHACSLQTMRSCRNKNHWSRQYGIMSQAFWIPSRSARQQKINPTDKPSNFAWVLSRF
jgi:hypothetical protein